MTACSLVQILVGAAGIVGAIVFTVVMWDEPKRSRNTRDDSLASRDRESRERLARALAALPSRRTKPLALPASTVRPLETMDTSSAHVWRDK